MPKAPPAVRGKITLAAEHPARSTMLLCGTEAQNGYLACNPGTALRICGETQLYKLTATALQPRPGQRVSLQITPALRLAHRAGTEVHILGPEAAEQARDSAWRDGIREQTRQAA